MNLYMRASNAMADARQSDDVFARTGCDGGMCWEF
jgi:hypothetical protein